MLKLLIEEQAISQAGPDTEIHALRGQPGMIPRGVSDKVGVHFQQIPRDHQFTFLAAQVSALNSVLVLLQAQAVGMKCQGSVYDIPCFRRIVADASRLLASPIAAVSSAAFALQQFLVDLVGTSILAAVPESPRQLQFGQPIVRLSPENLAKEPDGSTVCPTGQVSASEFQAKPIVLGVISESVSEDVDCLSVMALQHRLLSSSQNPLDGILVAGERAHAVCRKADRR